MIEYLFNVNNYNKNSKTLIYIRYISEIEKVIFDNNLNKEYRIQKLEEILNWLNHINLQRKKVKGFTKPTRVALIQTVESALTIIKANNYWPPTYMSTKSIETTSDFIVNTQSIKNFQDFVEYLKYERIHLIFSSEKAEVEVAIF